MFTPSKIEGPRPRALLTFPTNIPSLPGLASPACPSSSKRHSPLVTFPRPLFSYSYELLFPEALYSDNHPHCPRVSPVLLSDSRLLRLCDLRVSVANPLFSYYCALLFSLCSLFHTRSFCFQSSADSFAKTPRVWVPRTSRIPYLERRTQGLAAAAFLPGVASFAA